MLELITGADETEARKPLVGATLDDLARAGAQRMIETALRVEVEEYVARFRGSEMPPAMPSWFATGRPGRARG